MDYTSEMDGYYARVHELVLRCGEITLSVKVDQSKVETKSCDVDLVTETDKKVEDTLIGGLKADFPEHRFIGEETISNGGKCELTDAPTWIIDPIDGTMNFVHGFPHFCISVALFIEKIPAIAIIYNPTMNQMFSARKGKGAYLNEKRIHVSSVDNLSKALVMSEAGTSRDPDKMEAVIGNYTKLIPMIHGIRTLGSAALNMAMVALGGADANYEFGIHCWDIAAGQLLVEEAGGVCIDPAGGPFDLMSRRVLCASTNEIAQAIAKELVQFYPERD